MEEMIRVPIKDVGRISVDVNQFGHGMEKMLSGMSEVWGSLGVVSLPEYRAVPTSEQGMKPGKVQKAEAKGQNATEPNSEDRKDTSATVKPTDKAAAQEAPEAEEAMVKQQQKASEDSVPSSISLDDITSVIVARIKQNRSNSDVIQKLLTGYKVSKVSELKPGQYESFMTDLAQI
mgnify:CR=1 FL=1